MSHGSKFSITPPEHDRDHTCVFSMCVNHEHVEVITKKLNNERKTERRRQVREQGATS